MTQDSEQASGDNSEAEKSLPQQAVEGYMSIKDVYGNGGVIDQIMHSDDPPASAASGDDTGTDSGSDDSGSDDSGSDDSGSDDSGSDDSGE